MACGSAAGARRGHPGTPTLLLVPPSFAATRGMTAEVHASDEALRLDAIVPLGTWSVTVDGTLLVDGLSVTKNKVEGVQAGTSTRPLPADESPDAYDASVELILEGDARGYEIGALLTPVGDAPPRLGPPPRQKWRRRPRGRAPPCRSGATSRRRSGCSSWR